jgi:dienelactone hydrolase
MASKKPVILVIHGGWHTVEHYRAFIDILQEKGYTVVAPELPSGLEPTPEYPAEADLKVFSDTARKLADEGYEIIAVPHSYGGVIATEAFSGLGVKTRKAQGQPGGIRTMICIAAFLLGYGMTLEGNAPADALGWCSYEAGTIISL